MKPFIKEMAGAALIGVLALTSHFAIADTAAKRPAQASKANAAPQERTFPEQRYDSTARGKSALARLEASGKIAQFASFYQMTVEQVRELFRTDPTAATDHKGRLLFIEDAFLPDGTSDATPWVSNIPLAETFNLHSKKGAKRTIYLHFKDAFVTGTAWNASYGVDPIVAQAFDLDNLPNSFSDSELLAIQQMWKRTSEAYSAFDVNVTTELPPEGMLSRSSSTDETFGVAVLVTKNFTKTTVRGDCRCGGFAYVGQFASTSEYYKPAFAFYDMLASNVKYTSDAIIHEAGHVLGLRHDGTSTLGYYEGHGSGDTGWAPVMGAGYYRSLVQWSKGEYANANNKEDDYLVMQNNGLFFGQDDFGNTQASATSVAPITSNGMNEVVLKGIIHGPNDTDVIKIDAGAGTLSARVNVFSMAAMLDSKLTLKDSAGNVIVQADNPSVLSSELSFNLPAAGTYYLFVEGTGMGDPLGTGYTKYGSIGQYEFKVTFPIGSGIAPVAKASASKTTGDAPLSVSFSSSGSSDPDGIIVSYEWDFGDGTKANGANVTKTFESVGQYTVGLTVTDNSGLKSQASVVITTNKPVQAVNIVSVGSLQLTGSTSKNGMRTATATVSPVDQNGKPLSGVTVRGQWEVEGFVVEQEAIAKGRGTSIEFKSPTSKRPTTFVFRILNMTSSTHVYDSSKDSMSSGSVTF